MAFSDASRWVRISFFLNLLGLLLQGFILMYNTLAVHGYHFVPGAITTAALLILTTCLSFTWAFIDEAKDNKGVHFSTIVFGFLTAILSLVTAVLIGLDSGSITIVFFCGLSTFFVLLAAIFSCVEVSGEVTVRIPKIPSPRKAKKAKTEKDAEAGEGEKKEEAVELEESAKKEEEKKDEADTKEDEKKEEGATNGQVVKEEEEAVKPEEKKEEAEQKEEGEQKAEEEKKE